MTRVLIVEDDRDISSALASVLVEEGHAVACAFDGAEALSWLRANPAELPALILLDLSMPVLDGPGFRAAQRGDPALAGIPVVVLSAAANGRAAAASIGADGWLEKPVQIDRLLDVVERLRR